MAAAPATEVKTSRRLTIAGSPARGETRLVSGAWKEREPSARESIANGR